MVFRDPTGIHWVDFSNKSSPIYQEFQLKSRDLDEARMVLNINGIVSNCFYPVTDDGILLKDRKFRQEGKDGFTLYFLDGRKEAQLRIGDGERLVYSDPVLAYSLIDKVCLVNVLDQSHCYLKLAEGEQVLSL